MDLLQIASIAMAAGFCYCAARFFYVFVSRRDRFYGSLAKTLLLLGIAQALSATLFWPSEPAWLAAIRFAAFLILIGAILRLRTVR
jgi:hypothetical protein